jgi:hypothetical protein
MDDLDAQRRQLNTELQATESELIKRIHAWHYAFGPFHINRTITSRLTARIYVTFNAVCFIVGLILAPLGGALNTIGVSLIVGALFSFGALMSQFWALQAQVEIDVAREVLGKEAKFGELTEKRNDLHRRLETLDRENSPRPDEPLLPPT